jgi:two-component system, cell cycle response regulator
MEKYMTNATFAVEAFSRNGRRIIATVVSHIKSTLYNFTMVDEAGVTAPQIAIVDASDRQMNELLAAAKLRNPDLKVIHLVAIAGQTVGQQFEVLGSHMVSHLLPMLEQVAKTITTAAPKPAPVQTAPSIQNPVVQLVPKKAPERLRALVVDDSPTVRTQLAQIVERIGMRCDIASGGQEALNQLSTNTYNIIFVDVVMPDMDGYTLTRSIKRDRQHKATPVIILTSKSSPFDRARGALAGCDTYLTKPVELKRLFEATAQCLRKSMAVDDLEGLITDPTVKPVRPPVAGASPTSSSAQNPIPSTRLEVNSKR